MGTAHSLELRGRRGGEHLCEHAPEFESSGGSYILWWEMGAGGRSTNRSQDNNAFPGGAFKYTRRGAGDLLSNGVRPSREKVVHGRFL